MIKLVINIKVTPHMLRRAVHTGLQLNSNIRTPKQLLTPTMKVRKIERADKMFNYLKRHETMVKIFFNEKIIILDAVLICFNDQYMAKARTEVKAIFRTKHPAQVIGFRVVASDGKKIPLLFFNPGKNVNTEVNYEVSRYKILS